MKDFKEKYQKRLLNLSKDTIGFVITLPNTVEYQVIRRQLIRSVTSIGANYRAACRAKSDADFIYKLQIVEEECDESIYWMQLIGDLFNDKNERILTLINELEQVLAITISSIKKVKDRKNKKH